jgi:thioredoxin reductase (NADPH)
MHDLIIIGGGAAGLSAATYALGKQLDALVIYEDLGGKAGRRQTLAGQVGDEFLAGAEAVRIFERQVTAHANRALHDGVASVVKVAGVFHVETRHHGTLESPAVIVATGARPVALDVPGASALVGYGLGYSVTTHAHLLAGKSVAVIGTSTRSLRGVAELARTALQIYLVAPDPRGLETPLARALRRFPNVELLGGAVVDEVIGTQNVEQIVVAQGGRQLRLNVDAAFVDLGLRPNSELVRKIVQTNQDGFVWVDDRNATTMPGLFAAGDVTTSFGEQTLIAIGEGARAALSAYDYLLTWLPVPQMMAAD